MTTKRKKIKITCIVREKLARNKTKYHDKVRWEKLLDKLQKEYCIESSCLTCPLLKIGE